ncbi:LysR family transcriptional regulator [Tsukamurella sp. 8F]|uniref:LysR family transcriptional regulator n=1 Tax=unclassified Tsukamurella TaxID=2633480 RepID=UPI0023B8E3ED|nr:MULTISPECIES: LysR family transcriptional regulator [unclassified Tsukamurella]MDF0530518.1 LysR family transcriptional regulator [Tsukamurella sp. 8J]MDF0586832.1 LysR family transcriptional regulator [Tsukamurella sp. 8F]
MLDVRRMTLLRELARRGTIAAVAEALSYTPSAVSQQLATLEREAGVPLLERTGRSVALTPVAETLVAHTEQVLTTLEVAEAELRSAGGRVTGSLAIGAFATAMRTLVTPALVALSTDHPALHVGVVEVDPATAPGDLRAGGLDIALLHTYDGVPESRDPGLEYRPLLGEALLLAGGPRTVADAADQDWVTASPGTLCHAATVRICEAAGFTPRIRHHADDFAAVIALVDAGQGVALVPELAADAATGFRPIGARRHTWLAYRNGTGGDPRVAAGLRALRTAATSR